MTAREISPLKVLFLIDTGDRRYLPDRFESAHWVIAPEVLDFRKLASRIEHIDRLATAHDADLVLYSQNEQVGKRAGIGAVHQRLGLGYSSVSAIDRLGPDAERVQMRACFDAFVCCDREMQCSTPPPGEGRGQSGRNGSFSLVFDTEQIGGVMYGLPRILSLLARYDIRATFFATNLVNRVFPGLFNTICRFGHELAPHGLFHEHLSPLGLDEQQSRIQAMIDEMGRRPHGANFIFRMNEDTVNALIRLDMSYFVFFDTNYYRLISYPKRPTAPVRVRCASGEIWAIPISVETYGLPWFAIRNMLDTALVTSRRCGFPHVSVLMHPFRDGSTSNLKVTEAIIRYLVGKGLEPIALAELVQRLDPMAAHTSGPIDRRRMLETHRPSVSWPSTRWDVGGFVPHTAMSILNKVTGRSIF